MKKCNLLKMIFLMLLIINTQFSNAAISISDANAFMTKTEFSAELNHLAMRMSNMQNSIDSKIDALVSTYLSRNGIWNGVAQLTTTLELNTVSSATLRNSLQQKQYNLISGASSGTNLNKTYTIKTNVNKTGMALVQFESKGNGAIVVQASQSGSDPKYNSNNIDNLIKGSANMVLNVFKVSDKTTTQVGSSEIAIVTGHIYTNGTNYYTSRTIAWQKLQFPMQFFVTKADNVVYNYMTYNNFGVTAYTTAVDYESGTFGYKVTSFVVY